MNLLESLFSAAIEPAPPLHAGEAMALWTYAVALNEGRSLCLFLLNHTTDPELKRLMEHFIDSVEEPQIKRLHQFMREKEIPLPSATSDKGKGDPNEVPLSARLTDGEIANMFVAKLLAGVQILNAGIIQAVRDDVTAMLYTFQTELLKEGFILKRTMLTRGWLKFPPYFGTHGFTQ